MVNELFPWSGVLFLFEQPVFLNISSIKGSNPPTCLLGKWTNIKDKRTLAHLSLRRNTLYLTYLIFVHIFRRNIELHHYKSTNFKKIFVLLFNYSCLPFLPIPPPHPSHQLLNFSVLPSTFTSLNTYTDAQPLAIWLIVNLRSLRLEERKKRNGKFN